MIVPGTADLVVQCLVPNVFGPFANAGFLVGQQVHSSVVLIEIIQGYPASQMGLVIVGYVA